MDCVLLCFYLLKRGGTKVAISIGNQNAMEVETPNLERGWTQMAVRQEERPVFSPVPARLVVVKGQTNPDQEYARLEAQYNSLRSNWDWFVATEEATYNEQGELIRVRIHQN